jgi:hypothetical protein
MLALFKHILGLLVSGVLVRMITEGKLAVSLLYLRLRRIPVNTQHLVIIAFFTVCQNRSSWAKGKGQKAKGELFSPP